MLMLLICSFMLFGCNDDAAGGGADNAAAENDAGDDGRDETPAPAPGTDANREDAKQEADKDESADTVTITRIDDPPLIQAPVVTGTGQLVTQDNFDTVTPSNKTTDAAKEDTSDVDDKKDSDGDGIPDSMEHEPTPRLFPVGSCLVEISGKRGTYNTTLALDIINKINEERAIYLIGPVTENTSLMACADIRAKELVYYPGHFRPDGSKWDTVAPGYFIGECLTIDYNGVDDIVDAWLSVNSSRVELMNPAYTQVGVSSYDCNDHHFVVAAFGY